MQASHSSRIWHLYYMNKWPLAFYFYFPEIVTQMNSHKLTSYISGGKIRYFRLLILSQYQNTPFLSSGTYLVILCNEYFISCQWLTGNDFNLGLVLEEGMYYSEKLSLLLKCTLLLFVSHYLQYTKLKVIKCCNELKLKDQSTRKAGLRRSSRISPRDLLGFFRTELF